MFQNSFVRTSPDTISPFHSNLESYYVVIVPIQAFANSSRIERHVQCAQSSVHLVKSAALSGSSLLHASMNFGSRN